MSKHVEEAAVMVKWTIIVGVCFVVAFLVVKVVAGSNADAAAERREYQRLKTEIDRSAREFTR